LGSVVGLSRACASLRVLLCRSQANRSALLRVDWSDEHDEPLSSVASLLAAR